MNSFAKSFLLSLVSFIGINFAFGIIYLVLTDNLNSILTNPLILMIYLFGSILYLPYLLIVRFGTIIGILTTSYSLGAVGLLFLLIGYIIAPLIAAVVAGRLADTKLIALGSWILTASLSAAILIIIFIINIYAINIPSIEIFIESFTIELFNSMGLSSTDISNLLSNLPWIPTVIATLFSILNAIFYGFFALMSQKISYF